MLVRLRFSRLGLFVAGIIAATTLAVAPAATAQTSSTNEWTWMGGSSTANQIGVYGTLGTASSSNVPGGRSNSVSWTDSKGNFWLFGGYVSVLPSGYQEGLNDLWEYSPTAKTWTWVSGSSTTNASGVYGTLGVAAASSTPGARPDSVGWTDTSGNLWLFGGTGLGAMGGLGDFNDLWEFNPTTKQWTWIAGANTVNAKGTYGTLGTSAMANIPGARDSFASWTDSSGNLWLFGGEGYDSTGTQGGLNDLWEFSPTTKTWTWVGGSNTVNASGMYGTLGTAAATNVPGARSSFTSWKDSGGNFWLYGGNGYGANGSVGYLADLWEFSPTTKQWTWVSGSSAGGAVPVYGTLGVPSASSTPGGRIWSVGWGDSSGNLWLFGGLEPPTYTNHNDLWEFSPSTKQWTWVGGSNTGEAKGVYGTLGTASTSNVPGARGDGIAGGTPVSWSDTQGNLWLFGGNGYDANGNDGDLNDLWKYQPSTTTPTVTVTPSPTSITTTQALTVTVAVSAGSNLTTPTGSVTLTSGSSYTSAATVLSGGSATINIPAGSLATGSYTLTASYTPDSTSSSIYATASGSKAVAVSASTTTLTLSANPTSSTYAQQVVLIATLSPYSAQSISSTGESVTFYNGTSSLGTGTLSSGVATLNITALLVGTDSLKAVYAGDTNFSTSTSTTLPFTIATASQTISFTAPTSPVAYGVSPITLVATGGGSGNAVVFSVVSGPATISGTNGRSLTITGVGTVVVAANQAGNTNYAAAPQVTQSVVVNAVQAISSLSPAFTSSGGTAFTLTVNGSGFISGSTIYWGTSALPTTYVSANQLTAQVPATDIATGGTTVAITVLNTSAGGTSNPFQFEVNSTSGSTTAPTFGSTTATVTAGSTASYPVTLPSTVSDVSVTCLNLPTGATCSYSATTNTVTITTSLATPKGTYQVTIVFTGTASGAASGFILLPLLLLPLMFARKRLTARSIWLTTGLGLALLVSAATMIGCGSPSSGSSSTASSTHQVTRSGAVNLTVQ